VDSDLVEVGIARGKEVQLMNHGEVESIERYYESLERWDTKFGKVYVHGRGLSMLGEEPFLWSGLLAKSELRRLLDELFEHALEGESSSWRRTQVLEGVASRR
jgi:hypothetical protein